MPMSVVKAMIALRVEDLISGLVRIHLMPIFVVKAMIALRVLYVLAFVFYAMIAMPVIYLINAYFCSLSNGDTAK